jgi:hypothetical protein
MHESAVFLPPQQRGMIIHAILIPIPLAIGGFSLARAIQTKVGPTFLIYLLVFIVMAVIAPLLIYQIYALLRSAYTIDREGIRIQWGLRVEDIPMPDVLWVRRARDLDLPMQLPWLRLPGALRGTRSLKDIGQVEFLAADPRSLIIIATPGRVYAISPQDPEGFLGSFQELIELGSLTPIPARSIRPTFLLARVWADRPARYLILIGLFLGLGVVIWVATLIPTEEQISVGFNSAGTLRRPGPIAQIILLPVVSSFFLIIDLLLGMFFYRQSYSKPLAYVLWIAGVLTSALFLFILFLIVAT